MSRISGIEGLRKLLDAFGRRTRQVSYKLPICTRNEEDENDVDEQEKEVPG